MTVEIKLLQVSLRPSTMNQSSIIYVVKLDEISGGRKMNSKTTEGQTEIVQSEDRKEHGHKMKRKTNIDQANMTLRPLQIDKK